MIKRIKGTEHYYISDEGKVFSDYKGKLKERSLWLDGKKRYLMVNWIVNGKNKKFLVHRLVAEAFIENPNNYDVINHIDGNPRNNKTSNLEWCTTQHNIHESYKTMDQYRNCIKVKLFKNNIEIGRFRSISEAARYASNNFGASYSSLDKYHINKEFSIKRCND